MAAARKAASMVDPVQLAHHPERLRAVGAFGHHLEARLALQEPLQSIPEDLMVVRDGNPDGS